MSNVSNITIVTTTTSSFLKFSSTARVWIYLIPNVLSICCSIFVLYHFLFKRTLRQALNNHVIIILIIIGLIYELTDVFWLIHYYHFHFALFSTPAFALIWMYIDFAFEITQVMLFAWATIERHILIFHSGWLSTKKKRFFVHYLPIIIIITYGMVYYGVIIFFPLCSFTFDNTHLYGVTGNPCIYKFIPFIAKWDWIVNQIIPTVIIIIFSLALLIRVLLQKHRLHRSINWKKQRKMIIQLISISLIYFIFFIPYTLISAAYTFGLSRTFAPALAYYSGVFLFYMIFLVPFAACTTLPDFKTKIKQLFCCNYRRQRVVHPTT
ncbi:unnamed protein product [Adineta steineri]|uniref:G-protein coupled receptors family 1 profile domain-containing protein n=1 Tax=Adineta steineri TaxID=433720 RepID=A0A815XTD3_9BILA|nr:unnamed protein product [Adineta steineri]CAF1561512.1 unnamed protein product [Adineta steineri]